jgi:transposase
MSHPTQAPTEKSHARALVEERLDAPVRELLIRMYVEQGLSQVQIAKAFRVERRTVSRWMQEEGIPTRDRRALAPEVATA